jgi:hypothetical protein
MTDTATRKAGAANQYCGSCGAPVKVYWNACAKCRAPIGVTPVGSYDSSATQIIPTVAPEAAPEAAPTATASVASSFPSWTPPPRRTYATAPSMAPAPEPAPSYAPPASYEAPQQDYQAPPSWTSTAQAPPRNYTPAPAYSAPAPYEPPKKVKTGSSGPWMIIAIILAVLFLGSAVFAGVSAASVSSKNAKLSDARAQVTKLNGEVATANSALGSERATVATQSSEIAAYKACISDLNTLFADADNNRSVPASVSAALQRDCVPLGLIG